MPVTERENRLLLQVEWQRQAAECAVSYVESGAVVGLGTGRTAAFAVLRIGQLLRAGRLQGIAGVATSRAVEAHALALGIPLRSFNDVPEIDVTIDGADEVDPDLNLIKGGGGAMLHEKMVARASRVEIIVVDESKVALRLGTRASLPVEVVPFGWAHVAREIARLEGRPVLRMANGEPKLTDEGNYILDCRFERMEDLVALDRELRAIPGVVEHGLFVQLASMVVVAGRHGLRLLRPTGSRSGERVCDRYAAARRN